MCPLRRRVRQNDNEGCCRMAGRRLALLTAACVTGVGVSAQDLTPRAYVVTPVGSIAVVMSYSFSHGAVLTDPTLPITDFSGRVNVQALSYYTSFAILGRSANLTMSMPYAFARYRATVAGTEGEVSRSGLADGRLRVSMNLRGGKAMGIREFVAYREGVVIGTSLTVVLPTGQYDPARVINPGTNRWAVKPEVGFSKRWNRYVMDWYGGVWLFASNTAFFPGSSLRSQAPIGALEAHLSYYIKRSLWASLDGNFWTGGHSTVNGSSNRDAARNSRVGATVSLPITHHQSLKFSVSKGAYVLTGGDYTTVSAGWQYSWLRKNE